MTATANTDTTTEKEFGAVFSGKVVECVLPLMQYFGIKEITLNRLVSSSFTKLVPKIVQFKDIPQEYLPCVHAIKDSLTTLLAAVGVLGIKLDTSEEEENGLIAGYTSVVKNWKDNIGKLENSENSNESNQDTKVNVEVKKTKKRCSRKKCCV